MINRMISLLTLLLFVGAEVMCGPCSSKHEGYPTGTPLLEASSLKNARSTRSLANKNSITPVLFVNSQMLVSGDGQSWETAFMTIQGAVDAIKNDKRSSQKYTIAVAQGTYKVGGSGNMPMGQQMVFPFIMIKDLALSGFIRESLG